MGDKAVCVCGFDKVVCDNDKAVCEKDAVCEKVVCERVVSCM